MGSRLIAFPTTDIMFDIAAIDGAAFARTHMGVWYKWGPGVPMSVLTWPCDVKQVHGTITFYILCHDNSVWVYPANNEQSQFTTMYPVTIVGNYTVVKFIEKAKHGVLALGSDADFNQVVLRVPSPSTLSSTTDIYRMERMPDNIFPERVVDWCTGKESGTAVGASGKMYSYYPTVRESVMRTAAGQNYQPVRCIDICDFQSLAGTAVEKQAFVLFATGSNIAIGVTQNNSVMVWGAGSLPTIAHTGVGVTWRSVHGGNGVVAAITTSGVLYTAGLYSKGTDFSVAGTGDFQLTPLGAFTGVSIHTIGLSFRAATVVTSTGDVKSWGVGNGSTGTGVSVDTVPSTAATLLTNVTLPVSLFTSGEVNRTWILTRASFRNCCNSAATNLSLRTSH
jgi:hypothetical protein